MNQVNESNERRDTKVESLDVFGTVVEEEGRKRKSVI